MVMNAHRLVPALLLLLSAACASSESDPTALGAELQPGTVFLAQSEPPGAVMDALFDGTVARDGSGCLRLEGGDRPTVVWPYGAELTSRAGAFWVRDAAGREIGRIGGSFRFGGGEIPSLHDGIPLTAAQRSLAAERCPGRYWIVGEIL